MPTNTENSNSLSGKNNLDFLKLQYQVLSERRINHNTLLWNVPSLLFVAQAFLWTLALNDENNELICCGISLLSLLISYIAYQLFERNRLMEVVDAEQMYSIEKYIKNQNNVENPIPIMIIHNKISERTLIDGRYNMITDFLNYHPYYKHHNKKSSLCKKASSELWKILFILMTILSCAILLYNITKIPELIVSLQ